MRFAALPFLALVLAGCSSAKPPMLAVQGARITDRNDAATIVTFDVSADNGDHRQLPLTDVRYEVWINGQPAFRGRRYAETTLPGFGSQLLELPAAVAADVPSGATYRISGELWYRPPNYFRQTLNDAGVPYPSVGFSGEGSIGQ